MPSSVAATLAAKPKARIPFILPSPPCNVVLATLPCFDPVNVARWIALLTDAAFPSGVIDKRSNAAGKAKDARPAFAFDLLGGKAKRGNSAIHGKTVACRGAIKRRRDAEDFPSPFAKRNRESPLLAELDVRQRPPLDILGFLRTLRLYGLHVALEFILGEERQQRAAYGGGRYRCRETDVGNMRHGIGGAQRLDIDEVEPERHRNGDGAAGVSREVAHQGPR